MKLHIGLSEKAIASVCVWGGGGGEGDKKRGGCFSVCVCVWCVCVCVCVCKRIWATPKVSIKITVYSDIQVNIIKKK